MDTPHVVRARSCDPRCAGLRALSFSNLIPSTQAGSDGSCSPRLDRASRSQSWRAMHHFGTYCIDSNYKRGAGSCSPTRGKDAEQGALAAHRKSQAWRAQHHFGVSNIDGVHQRNPGSCSPDKGRPGCAISVLHGGAGGLHGGAASELDLVHGMIYCALANQTDAKHLKKGGPTRCHSVQEDCTEKPFASKKTLHSPRIVQARPFRAGAFQPPARLERQQKMTGTPSAPDPPLMLERSGFSSVPAPPPPALNVSAGCSRKVSISSLRSSATQRTAKIVAEAHSLPKTPRKKGTAGLIEPKEQMTAVEWYQARIVELQAAVRNSQLLAAKDSQFSPAMSTRSTCLGSSTRSLRATDASLVRINAPLEAPIEVGRGGDGFISDHVLTTPTNQASVSVSQQLIKEAPEAKVASIAHQKPDSAPLSPAEKTPAVDEPDCPSMPTGTETPRKPSQESAGHTDDDCSRSPNLTMTTDVGDGTPSCAPSESFADSVEGPSMLLADVQTTEYPSISAISPTPGAMYIDDC